MIDLTLMTSVFVTPFVIQRRGQRRPSDWKRACSPVGV